jgi:hypothetical protein
MSSSNGDKDAEAELNLPSGFGFHPIDDKLVEHYLCWKAMGRRLPVAIITVVDLYKNGTLVQGREERKAERTSIIEEKVA